MGTRRKKDEKRIENRETEKGGSLFVLSLSDPHPTQEVEVELQLPQEVGEKASLCPTALPWWSRAGGAKQDKEAEQILSSYSPPEKRVLDLSTACISPSPSHTKDSIS